MSSWIQIAAQHYYFIGPFKFNGFIFMTHVMIKPLKVSHHDHAFYKRFKLTLGPCRFVNGMTWAREWSAYRPAMLRKVVGSSLGDPVPLVEKSRGLSPGGRFPPSFIHQVIIITGLNKLQLYVLALKMALDADRA